MAIRLKSGQLRMLSFCRLSPSYWDEYSMIGNHIKAVTPAEDAAAYRAANPVQADGRIIFDKKANEAREDAIVRNTLRASEAAVLVLGGAHDLSDNVPAGVKLIVLTVKGHAGE